jgi:SAM-dependent methyltransferase
MLWIVRLQRSVQKEIGLPDTAEIVKCDKCCTAFTWPMPSEEQLDKIYSDVFSYPEEFSSADTKGHRKYIDQIEALCSGPPGKLLDIGCATGLILSLADSGGWETWGIDISPKLMKAAGSRVPRASLFVGQIEDAHFETGFFDAAIALNLLEHLITPVKLLSEVSRVLKPGGIFLFKTVMIDSIPAKRRRENWDHLKWPGHLIWYSKESLNAVLHQTGFLVKKVKVTGVPYVPGIKRYMDHRVSTDGSSGAAVHSKKTNTVTSMPIVKRSLKAILRSHSLKACASLINSTFKLGDTITVYAEKKSDQL